MFFLTSGWTTDEIFIKFLLSWLIAVNNSLFFIGNDWIKFGNFFFSFEKHSLLFLYRILTSLSASKTGQLNNFATKDLPDPMSPINPTLIIFSYIHLPPSTSNIDPVIILASSEHKKHAAFPMS